MNHSVVERERPAPNRITVLHISGSDQDQLHLRQILSRSNWVLHTARSCAEAINVCANRDIPVVICDSALPDGDWKSVIDRLSSSGFHPAVVVTSDTADNRVWAEVLNLGAYDLLSKPFDSLEVLRAIALAWHSWRRSCTLAASRKAEPKVAQATPAAAQYAVAG